MKSSHTRNGKLIFFVAGVFVGGVSHDTMSIWRMVNMDSIVPTGPAQDIENEWAPSLGEVSELLTANPIEHATRLPNQTSPVPTKEKTRFVLEPFLSMCPAKSSSSQNKSLLPKLHFIHIRKTGGTAVITSYEEAGLEPYQINYSIKMNKRALKEKRKPGNPEHIPPRYWIGLRNLGNIHLFATVRNPYDRAISEYYQHFKSGFHRPPENISVNDPSFLNHFIQAHYRRGAGDLFIPQYEYIFGPRGSRIVDHVLHFESLHDEFPKLMECYAMNLTLPNERVNKRQDGAALTVANLTAESIALINEVERISFEVFGYEMILVNSTLYGHNRTDFFR